ncbi:MerR family transcriptional regulator [Corynebacterium sp. HS2168-gen11]|uniref:transcriptional regulator FtsR n=1 Tax=Corynebacterium sp. HS2168-gen11 TaxID=2974027 RepID=UPI00216B46E6|nr:MerR family transcriptional regulator [Corynebacterium sp. HS2168-gen11]MCS4535047.1 MerR family transcriptional regulator [Corynebacterium sp. HS2168-gen11]
MSAVPNPTQHQAVAKPQKTMSIGVVLDILTAEFPDVTVSKIRYLESEGLVTPQRTKTGYRRFVQADVDRLRYVLTTQRDNYLPLRVIRQQLEAMDAGTITPILKTADDQPMVSPEKFRAPQVTRLTDSDVALKSGVETAFVIELAQAGVIRPDESGFFTADDVRIVSAAAALGEFGFHVRHLKPLTNAAARQAALISQAVLPVTHSKSVDARQQAEEMSQQIMALVASLHAGLVKNAVRKEIGF